LKANKIPQRNVEDVFPRLVGELNLIFRYDPSLEKTTEYNTGAGMASSALITCKWFPPMKFSEYSCAEVPVRNTSYEYSPTDRDRRDA
jgi:hypothetical protein